MENIPPEMRLSQVRYDLNVNIQNGFYKEKTIMGYNYYNSNGKKKDYSSKGLFGTTNYYGADGKKKGYSQKSWF